MALEEKAGQLLIEEAFLCERVKLKIAPWVFFLKGVLCNKQKLV